MVLSAIMIYLTYTPSDSRYFWTYWVSRLPKYTSLPPTI